MRRMLRRVRDWLVSVVAPPQVGGSKTKAGACGDPLIYKVYKPNLLYSDSEEWGFVVDHTTKGRHLGTLDDGDLDEEALAEVIVIFGRVSGLFDTDVDGLIINHDSSPDIWVYDASDGEPLLFLHVETH